MDPVIENISKQTEVPVSSVAQSFPPTPKPSRKFPKVLIFALLFVILAGAGGGIWYVQSQNQTRIVSEQAEGVSPTPPPPTPTPNPTAEWKTYTNQDFGYSIKYPMWVNMIEGACLQPPNGTVLKDPNMTGFYFIKNKESQNPQEENFLLCLSVDNSTNMHTLDQVLKEEIQDKQTKETSNQDSVTATLIDGTNAFTGRVNYETMGGMKLVTLHKDMMYQFIWTPDSVNTVDIMLSTFKFVDQDQVVNTSNWKTYTSAHEGASFQYPPEWKIEIVKNADGSGDDVKLQSPSGLSLIFIPSVSGLGGGCDPENCPLVKTRKVTPLQSANSKAPLYLIEGTTDQTKRLGIMSTGDGKQIPTVGEKRTFPYYLTFTNSKSGFAAFMLDDEFKEKSLRMFDKVSEEEFFNMSDVQEARQILSSFKYR